ncbi:MAG: helix-turn-helix domain-containing protein [Sphingomonas sp.]|nr:helix-turn-helix domain-containing protein [Sphingomonas sp.]
MDETETDGVVTVGQRLREAREAKGLSIEDIAAQTRIPTRHLASLEAGDWDKLPAATYSVGFAKNFAGAVGLDRAEIGEQLRLEMGGTRPTYSHPEVFEAADPARTMPKGLVIGALALLVLVVLAFTWLNNRSLEPEEAIAAENVTAPLANELAAPAEPAAATGPVVLTASDVVWIEVSDGGAILKQGELARGERYEVPANAVAPQLTTGKPEALSITVGTRQAPPVGEAGRTVSGVSLKAGDLLRQGPAPAASAPAAAAPAAATPAAALALPPAGRNAAATRRAGPAGEPATDTTPALAEEGAMPSPATGGDTSAQP